MGFSNVMLKTYRLVIIFVVSSLLNGCTIPTTCILFNNTPVTLQLDKIGLNGSIETFALQPHEIIELTSWVMYDYKISSKKEVWAYNPSDPSFTYVEQSGFGPFVKRFFQAQLEPDGRIFLLQPGMDPPVQSMPEQPKGYPLVPLISVKD